ncbi:MAG: hypothetical protein GC200_04810 [Tepidisphaera sp.]|nr:hypothetical protein [Tepidisphaera sp.]
MCTTVYLASSTPVPIIRPDAATHLSVTPLEQTNPALASLSRILSFPHISVVGAHTGCGCGFQGTNLDHAEDPDDIRTSRLLLSHYLAARLKEGAHLQIYACWAGDERRPSRSQRSITSEEIASHSFVERQLLDLG